MVIWIPLGSAKETDNTPQEGALSISLYIRTDLKESLSTVESVFIQRRWLTVSVFFFVSPLIVDATQISNANDSCCRYLTETENDFKVVEAYEESGAMPILRKHHDDAPRLQELHEVNTDTFF
jgi:hypothetical protein